MSEALKIPTSPQVGLYQNGGKRCIDFVGALGVLVVLAPALLLISALIIVTDPGPIIFVQRRVGRYGKVFHFFKFRSMPVGTKNLPSDQIGSVRLTWLGRLLRRTNLDELPQLVNILKGDMSFVGPRPSLPSQANLNKLRELHGALVCRPGLSGLAQVSSYDGMPIEAKASFDGEYAAAISLVRDVKIILRTFRYLTKPPPVY